MICCRGLWCFGRLCILLTASGLLLASLAPAEEITSGVGHSIVHVAAGGIAVYRSAMWGQVNLQLWNRSNEPLELLASTFFENEPTFL